MTSQRKPCGNPACPTQKTIPEPEVHDPSPEAVPWNDLPGPIPSLTMSDTGHMAHKSQSRKQKQKVGRTGRRPSGKSKAVA